MAQPVTFVFLHDPQPSSNRKGDDSNSIIKRLSQVNDQLNSLSTKLWPTAEQLQDKTNKLTADVAGTKFDVPKFIIFGGDMTQNGGLYNSNDQGLAVPAKYDGGYECTDVRWLYDPTYNPTTLVYRPPLNSSTRTNINQVYIGLGNHDMKTGSYSPVDPGVGWAEGGGAISTCANYYRCQMWNWFCQMNVGVGSAVPSNRVLPRYPVSYVDGDNSADWQKYSYNYRVDTEFFSIFQLHLCYGYGENGRASGVDWFKAQLKGIPLNYPIIIVQHFPFDNIENLELAPTWTQDIANELLTLIADHNVLALLTGHRHAAYPIVDRAVPVPGSSETIDQFRPGAAGPNPTFSGVVGNFSVIRVSGLGADTRPSFNIANGTAADPENGKELIWNDALGKTFEGVSYRLLTCPSRTYYPDTGIGNIGNNYFDTRPVYTTSLKPTQWVVGVYLKVWTPQSWNNHVFSPCVRIYDAETKQTITLENDDLGSFKPSYIDNNLYAGTNPQTVPEGDTLTGVKLEQVDNQMRIAIYTINSGDSPLPLVDPTGNYIPRDGLGGLGRNSHNVYADTSKYELLETLKPSCVITSVSLNWTPDPGNQVGIVSWYEENV